jgi:hypothetical protein
MRYGGVSFRKNPLVTQGYSSNMAPNYSHTGFGSCQSKNHLLQQSDKAFGSAGRYLIKKRQNTAPRLLL